MHRLNHWMPLIIDGFHFEMFVVDKLTKIFQIQYHSFTSVFFIPGENTLSELIIFCWATDNNFFLE